MRWCGGGKGSGIREVGREGCSSKKDSGWGARDEAVEEVGGDGGGIVGEAGVDGGDLDDGVPRGDEPMEALAEGETGDGTGGGVAGGDAVEGVELTGDLREVQGGPKGVEAGGLAADVCGEEAALEAKDDDAGV